MSVILRTTRLIDGQIEEFLNLVSESAILFGMTLEDYLAERTEQFADRVEKLCEYERKADTIRIHTEKYLYEHTLIPENRGDVLAILENTDEVIDNLKDIIVHFSVEKPVIPKDLHDLFLQTSRSSVAAVDMLVMGVRAFFSDLYAVNNYVHKVNFFERETDQLGERLRRQIFMTDLDLSHKIHLRYFAMHVEKISDFAQAVCDRLAIYTIKREF